MAVDKKNIRSCIFLHMYYPAFINGLYGKHTELPRKPYQEQLSKLRNAHFGDSDFYSRNLMAAGWKADDLILNVAPLQSAWAKERNIAAENWFSLAIEQLACLRPDVVYLQDVSIASRAFIEAIRPHAKLIVGQIASPIPDGIYIEGFDILISSFPHFVEQFRNKGVASYYQPLAFEPLILDDMAAPTERNISCSFVGGISQVHGKATTLLEYLASATDIQFWGYGSENLPAHSSIRQKHHGEVWGKEMFGILRRSQMTVNRHIDVAGRYANNMRLFEATGCGAMIITDAKENLHELFEPGKEVVVYHSPEECAELIRYYEEHPEAAASIAQAGQIRTLNDHTYAARMKQTAEWLERHLRFKEGREQYRELHQSHVSTGHTTIDKQEITGRLQRGWMAEELPQRQRALVQQQLESMYKGEVVPPYRIAAEAFAEVVRIGASVLEIGCSSGYYYEVLEYLLSKKLRYTGVDISPAFIAMAKEYYPSAQFSVADGAELPFADASFDIVFSAGVLLYAVDYQQHIAETCRVADNVIIVHRTPLCFSRPTQFLKKRAYGVETVELVFNERELLNEFAKYGYMPENSLVIEENANEDYAEKTFVFTKKQRVVASNSATTEHTTQNMKLEGTPPFSPTTQPEEILQQRANGFFLAGQQLLQQGNTAEALRHFDEAMIVYPQILNLQYLRAFCLWKLGRVDEAFTALSAELKVAPHNQQALFAASIAARAVKPFMESVAIDVFADIKNQIEMLRRFEFKIYSQSGEDGILMGIFSRIGVTNKRFIEIGIGNGDECNTANLSLNHGWSGLLIDGDHKQVEAARQFYGHLNGVRVEQCFVTVDNINELFIKNRMTGEIDMFSLDIDGNDYWVLERINVIKPRVVMLEYNPSLGPERSISIPYYPEFYRMDYHKSGWYHGASLTALTSLMKSKGYILVGCDSNGYNAFFIREDVAEGVFREITPSEAYYPAKPRFRYGTPDAQFDVIKHLKFVEIP